MNPIDLHHAGRERSVGCYLLDTEDGPALFDCGPTTTIPALENGLDQHGVADPPSVQPGAVGGVEVGEYPSARGVLQPPKSRSSF